jgi:radical SAM protein with 4Fe4S-binding SPASM domain
MDDEIIPFVNLWRHIAVDYIQFRPIMSNYGRTYECDQAATLDRVDTARKLDSRVVKSDAKYNAMESGETGMTKRCHGTFLETAIAADGLVYVCCHLKSLPEFAIGNLHSQSFRTIWESHIHAKTFFTVPQCSTFCRHYGTNSFIEDEVLKPRTHENFI